MMFHEERSLRPLTVAIAIILLILATGTVVFMKLENLSPLDALYFSTVTLGTVGYGDLSPTKPESRAFAIVFIIFGVSVFMYTFGIVISIVFEGKLIEVFKMERATEKINKLRDHVVLCGYGDFGVRVAEKVSPIVVVEKDEANFSRIIERGLLGVNGDSTQKDVLSNAGVERAKAMIIALNSDPDVVFTMLSAKELNPKIRIYARANRKDSVDKMKWAGADYVVCLTEIGSQELIKALKGDQFM